MKVPNRLLVGFVLVGFLPACIPGTTPTSPPQSPAPSPTTSLPSAMPAPPTVTPLPSPTDTPAPDIPPWPLLQRGDWGKPEVFALQRLLRHHGFTVVADGKFGGQTLDAVLNFQTSKGLSADGLVGQLTWSALVQDVLVQEGQSEEAVRAVQYLLHNKFGYSVEADGIFGPETAEAVKNFQASINLIPDGLVGPQTWQALMAVEP